MIVSGDVLKTFSWWSFFWEDQTDFVRLTFQTPVTAFALDWDWVLVEEEDSRTQRIEATIFDGVTELGDASFVPEDMSSPFWGILSTVPFTEVVFRESGNPGNTCGTIFTQCTLRMDVDNLRYVPTSVQRRLLSQDH